MCQLIHGGTANAQMATNKWSAQSEADRHSQLPVAQAETQIAAGEDVKPHSCVWRGHRRKRAWDTWSARAIN